MALHDIPLYREFAKLEGVMARRPDEPTILRFRHLLEQHNLAVDMLQAKGLLMRTGTVVKATLISAHSSTKNAEFEDEVSPQGQQQLLR